MVTSPEITRLLQEVRGGNRSAFDEIFPFVYDELARMAHGRLQQFRPGQTLNTTALIHEAYLKLINQEPVDWHDRAHFFALASRVMRSVLIDYARKRSAQKRGGEYDEVPLDSLQIAADRRAADLITLNDALDALVTRSERQARLVEYRFFGGLTFEEIADVMGLSVSTVKRDWRRARTWLYNMMSDEGS